MLEFRPQMLYGLVIIVVTWAVIYAIGYALVTRQSDASPEERNRQRVRFVRVLNTLGVVVLLLWLLAVVWTGWRAPETGQNPAGELDQQPRSTETEEQPEIETSENVKEEIRRQGEQLQKEKKADLEDWRKKFFEENQSE